MNNGSYISVDFNVQKLKIFFSHTSPQGAYKKVKQYLESHGYEHVKDSNFKCNNLSHTDALKIIYEFAEENKWFSSSIKKVNIMPLSDQWDITLDIKNDYLDVSWEKEKSKEYQQYSKNINTGYER